MPLLTNYFSNGPRISFAILWTLLLWFKSMSCTSLLHICKKIMCLTTNSTLTRWCKNGNEVSRLVLGCMHEIRKREIKHNLRISHILNVICESNTKNSFPRYGFKAAYELIFPGLESIKSSAFVSNSIQKILWEHFNFSKQTFLGKLSAAMYRLKIIFNGKNNTQLTFGWKIEEAKIYF